MMMMNSCRIEEQQREGAMEGFKREKHGVSEKFL
jgi:hypothetical protein